MCIIIIIYLGERIELYRLGNALNRVCSIYALSRSENLYGGNGEYIIEIPHNIYNNTTRHCIIVTAKKNIIHIVLSYTGL